MIISHLLRSLSRFRTWIVIAVPGLFTFRAYLETGDPSGRDALEDETECERISPE